MQCVLFCFLRKFLSLHGFIELFRELELIVPFFLMLAHYNKTYFYMGNLFHAYTQSNDKDEDIGKRKEKKRRNWIRPASSIRKLIRLDIHSNRLTVVKFVENRLVRVSDQAKPAAVHGAPAERRIIDCALIDVTANMRLVKMYWSGSNVFLKCGLLRYYTQMWNRLIREVEIRLFDLLEKSDPLICVLFTILKNTKNYNVKIEINVRHKMNLLGAVQENRSTENRKEKVVRMDPKEEKYWEEWWEEEKERNK
ncbi:hypothetical protein Ahy_B06g085913 isoform B [Arachis hypogaea]|uniref:Uncharacterized protein n=1 Tax=Arachis hypogaea TaxID=3818 RepID=A0A444YW17_ARAHY|nr:hypothetical protein Ahy_B06g085913 isoform B [Arachis hypogaea]